MSPGCSESVIRGGRCYGRGRPRIALRSMRATAYGYAANVVGPRKTLERLHAQREVPACVCLQQLDTLTPWQNLTKFKMRRI